MKINKLNRWTAVAIFFIFMLLHQTDRLLIGPLTSSIMAEFDLNESQMGGIISGALLISSVFYPIWGILYDRFARPKLLALASLAWGLTTWLSAIAPTAPLFMLTRASTGIDDSSYSGMASLISDYFPPKTGADLWFFTNFNSFGLPFRPLLRSPFWTPDWMAYGFCNHRFNGYSPVNSYRSWCKRCAPG